MNNVGQILSFIGILVLGVALGYFFAFKHAKQQAEENFLKILEQNTLEYENKLLLLQDTKDSLQLQIFQVNLVVDSLNTSIVKRNNELNKLRNDYSKTVESIDNMSNNELVNFFSNRYKN